MNDRFGQPRVQVVIQGATNSIQLLADTLNAQDLVVIFAEFAELIHVTFKQIRMVFSKHPFFSGRDILAECRMETGQEFSYLRDRVKITFGKRITLNPRQNLEHTFFQADPARLVGPFLGAWHGQAMGGQTPERFMVEEDHPFFGKFRRPGTNDKTPLPNLDGVLPRGRTAETLYRHRLAHPEGVENLFQKLNGHNFENTCSMWAYGAGDCETGGVNMAGYLASDNLNASRNLSVRSLDWGVNPNRSSSLGSWILAIRFHPLFIP